jgi:putative intracellular protease/amidase
MSADQRIQHVFQELSRRSPLLFLFFMLATGLCTMAFGQNTTMTELGTSPNVKAGTAVTFVAMVIPGGQQVANGQVQICDATAKYCTGPALLAKAQLTADGTAIGKLLLGIGTHSFKAMYQGTSQFAASSSAVSTTVVNGARATSTALSISEPLISTGDGRPDIAVTEGSQLLVLLNQGSGVFAATPQQLTTGNITGFFGIAVADLNGDGLPDVITSSADGTLTVSYSAGSGNFNQTVQQVGAGELAGLAVADFDLDGVPDLIVNEATANTSAIFLSLSIGSVTFSNVAVPGSSYRKPSFRP